jgi:hypothetical protein
VRDRIGAGEGDGSVFAVLVMSKWMLPMSPLVPA